jgi:hypothetical protein
MKALEFDSTISESGDIALPPEVASEIPAGHPLRVVVMWDSGVDTAWRASGRRAFEVAFAPEDEIYEQLLDESR